MVLLNVRLLIPVRVFIFLTTQYVICIPQQLPLCRMIACMHSALTGDESQVKSTVAKTKNKEMGNQHLLSPSHLTHFLYRSTYLLLYYYYADSWKKIGIISKRIGYYQTGKFGTLSFYSDFRQLLVMISSPTRHIVRHIV